MNNNTIRQYILSIDGLNQSQTIDKPINVAETIETAEVVVGILNTIYKTNDKSTKG